VSVLNVTETGRQLSPFVNGRDKDSMKAELAFEDVLHSAVKDGVMGETASAVAEKEATSDEELPLEAYALPKWYTSYVVDSGYIAQVNHGVFAFAEKLRADGEISDADRAAIRNYLTHDPVHQEMLRHESFMHEHKNEISEYNTILDKAFKESLEEIGVNGARDYYESVVLDPAHNESMHQIMEAKLKEQPRFLELMKELGTSFV